MSIEQKVGLAGVGALGSAVAKALQDGIDGFVLHAVSDLEPQSDFGVSNVDFEILAQECDLIVECLPPHVVPDLARAVFAHDKDLVLISACALLMFPEIEKQRAQSQSRILVPSGALIGMDAVRALKEMGIVRAKIASTKNPKGFAGAPYVIENALDLEVIDEKTLIFEGNALEAAQGFPANVNVAATLSLAGIGARNTRVEIWADPGVNTNSHEITVTGEFSTLHARVENKPDPSNPKSSMLAAQSIVTYLRGLSGSVVVV